MNQAIIESTFDWAFLGPDTYQGTTSSDGVITEFINVGDRQYSRELGAEPGGVVVITAEGGLSALNPIRGTQGVLDILDTFTKVQELGTVSLAGQDVEHYFGSLDIDQMIEQELDEMGLSDAELQEAIASFESFRSATLDAELWVDPESSRIVRMKLNGRIPFTTSSSNGSSTNEEMTFTTDVTYDYPELPPDISAPINSLGEPEAGWSRTL